MSNFISSHWYLKYTLSFISVFQGIGGGGSSTQKSSGLERKSSKPSLSQSRSYGSASLLMAELQRKRSQQSLLQNLVANSLQNGNNSSSNLLNTSFESGNSGGLSNTAIAQIARNASGMFNIEKLLDCLNFVSSSLLIFYHDFVKSCENCRSGCFWTFYE